jgi:hypothetical protein
MKVGKWDPAERFRRYRRFRKRRQTKLAVSPRPHWITITLGALSPVTAILAVTFTFMGYRLSTESLRISQQALATSQQGVVTSQQSLRVGQRAYLSVKNTEISIADNTAEDHLSLTGEDVGGSLFLRYKFDVANFGNTPADITGVELMFSEFQSPWQFFDWQQKLVPPGAPMVMEPGTQFTVAPSTSLIRAYRDIEIKLLQTYKERQKYLKIPNSGTPFMWTRVESVAVTAKLKYIDVFGDSHSLQWCWRVYVPGDGNPLDLC